MNDASGDLTATGHRGFKGSHREAGLHPGIDGVAHDAAREGVLDGAQIQLALAGGVLGDVCEPQPVRPVGGDIALDPVIVDRRPGLGVLAAAPSPAERTPPAVVPADPPGGPLGHRLTSGTGLVEEEPVAELGIVAVRVEQRVGPVCLGHLGIGDRAGQPPVVGLAGQPSTRHVTATGTR